MEKMQEFRCKDGSIRRTGGIGPENEVELVKVFLGMEFGRYDGAEWGYIFGKNPDGTVAILVPTNSEDCAYAEIFTACRWDDHFNAYYAGGDQVVIDDGAISYGFTKGGKDE